MSLQKEVLAREACVQALTEGRTANPHSDACSRRGEASILGANPGEAEVAEDATTEAPGLGQRARKTPFGDPIGAGAEIKRSEAWRKDWWTQRTMELMRAWNLTSTSWPKQRPQTVIGAQVTSLRDCAWDSHGVGHEERRYDWVQGRCDAWAPSCCVCRGFPQAGSNDSENSRSKQ